MTSTKIQDSVEPSVSEAPELDDSAVNETSLENEAIARLSVSIEEKNNRGRFAKLNHLLRSLSPRYVIFALAGVSATAAIGLILTNQNAAPKIVENTPTQFDERTEFLNSTPFTCAEKSRYSKVPGEYKALLVSCIQAQSTQVFRAVDKNERDMIFFYAAKMRLEAQAEANSGNLLNTASAEALFSMSTCPVDTNNPMICVLGRKMAEAIDNVTQGEAEENGEKIATGLYRYKVALAAMSENGDRATTYTFRWATAGMRSALQALIIANNPTIGSQVLVLPQSAPSTNVAPNGIGTSPVNTTNDISPDSIP